MGYVSLPEDYPPGNEKTHIPYVQKRALLIQDEFPPPFSPRLDSCDRFRLPGGFFVFPSH